MTTEIQYTVEWTINSGQLAEFKEIAKNVTSLVRNNEPEMKSYEWFFNEDETKCYTIEHQTSSDSLMAHLRNVADVLPEVLKYSKLTRFEVFGSLNEEATAAVKSLGAVIHSNFVGFTR